MTPRALRRASAALLLLCGGCAASTRELGPDGGYAFPGAFDVTQAVTVASGGDDAREVLASLRRRGGDYDVTLFEPVFAVPVVTASLHAGVVREEVLAPGVPEGQGKRLVALLGALYGGAFPAPRAGTTEGASGGFRYRLGDIAEGASCPFPATIDVSPRLGRWPTLHVRTIEVTCVVDEHGAVERRPLVGEEVVDGVPRRREP